MFEPLFQTILHRPYVLAFLAAYVILCVKLTDFRFMILYLVIGYLIAFTSEYLSINFGFPYGWYFYKYENLQGELLLAGVPVWDSISYVFMNFAGLCVGQITTNKKEFKNVALRGPVGLQFPTVLWLDKLFASVFKRFCFAFRAVANPPPAATPRVPTFLNSFPLLMTSALFVTLLDVVVDPTAHLGSRWFLGDVYYYPNPGWYFDVPFSNFAGWFFVSLLINGVGIFLFKFCEIQKLRWPKPNFATIGAIGLYYGIFAFGLGIAIFLQEWLLVACDLFWIGLTMFLLVRSRANLLSHRDCL